METGSRDHAQVHLPPLTPHEALVFVNLLEKICRALWRAHGTGMAQILQRVVDAHVAGTPSPLDHRPGPEPPTARGNIP